MSRYLLLLMLALLWPRIGRTELPPANAWQFIDADTMQPIEGAWVNILWRTTTQEVSPCVGAELKRTGTDGWVRFTASDPTWRATTPVVFIPGYEPFQYQWERPDSQHVTSYVQHDPKYVGQLPEFDKRLQKLGYSLDGLLWTRTHAKAGFTAPTDQSRKYFVKYRSLPERAAPFFPAIGRTCSSSGARNAGLDAATINAVNNQRQEAAARYICDSVWEPVLPVKETTPGAKRSFDFIGTAVPDLAKIHFPNGFDTTQRLKLCAALKKWDEQVKVNSTPAVAEHQFIDADTMKPIEGVWVNLGWRKTIHPNGASVCTGRELQRSDRDGRVRFTAPDLVSFREAMPQIFVPGYETFRYRWMQPDYKHVTAFIEQQQTEHGRYPSIERRLQDLGYTYQADDHEWTKVYPIRALPPQVPVGDVRFYVTFRSLPGWVANFLPYVGTLCTEPGAKNVGLEPENVAASNKQRAEFAARYFCDPALDALTDYPVGERPGWTFLNVAIPDLINRHYPQGLNSAERKSFCTMLNQPKTKDAGHE